MIVTRLTTLLVSSAALFLLVGCSALPFSPEGPRTSEPSPTLIETEEAEEGSRENPYSVGVSVAFSRLGTHEWTVKVGSGTRHADEKVLEENFLNEPAPEGSEYVLLPVTFTRVVDDPAKPSRDFQAAFVTAGGHTYEASRAVVPDDWFFIEDLYGGASTTGMIGFVIPSDELLGGTWRISRGQAHGHWAV